MKAQERRQLKQNEFAETVKQVTAFVTKHRDRVILATVATLVLIAVVVGYLVWHQRTEDRASSLLATAMAVSESPIAPPPTVPGATQAAGTYPTQQARDEAALQAFRQVVASFSSTRAAATARYQAAAELLALGRFPEAEKAFQEVVDTAGTSFYGASGRMGLAETSVAEGQYDKAIKIYTDLAAQRDGLLPVDGVLMQLARTYVKAGKPADARAAFQRVVDEFPDSAYAPQAKQELVLLN